MKLPERLIWITVLLILAAVALTIVRGYVEEATLYKMQVNAVQLENKQYRNKQNELVSEKLAFVGEKKDLKKQIDVLKKSGDTLRTKISSFTRQLFYLKRIIEINGSGDVITFTSDTQYVIGPTVIDTPLLAVDTADRFHSFKFAGNLNKYAYQVRVFDNSELATEDLGKKGTLVRLTNHNPYVISSEVQSLLIRPKKTSVWKKIFWIGVGAGAGWGVFR